MQMTQNSKHTTTLDSTRKAANPQRGRFITTETPLERERRLEINSARATKKKTTARNRVAESTSLCPAKTTPSTRHREEATGTTDMNRGSNRGTQQEYS